MYETETAMTNVGELRWKLFTKKPFEAQKCHRHKELYMKPLFGHITGPWFGIRIQCLPQLPPATSYGWRTGDVRLVPITTMEHPAPAHTWSTVARISPAQMCGADEERCDNVR